MVVEDVAQMGPMLILAGLAIGWLSEAVQCSGGYGLLADMSVALVGSVLVGGIVLGAISTGLGMVAMFTIGCGGAALAVLAQRSVWPSRRAGS